MKKWLLYPLVLIAVFALVISAAILIGRVQPLPKRMALLHLGEMCELPCWIGIMPGKTLVGEARLIIAKVYNQKSSLQVATLQNFAGIITADGQQLGITINGSGGSVFAVKSDDVVRSIELWVYPISAGDAITALGPPDGIDLGYECCAGIIAKKQWARIGVASTAIDNLSPRYIDPSDPVRYISLFAAQNTRYDMPWHGFGIYQLIFESVTPIG